MSTDRELLEAAAKAAGHGVYFDEVSGMTFMGDRFSGLLWNPLHHDGDALQLAVTIGMQINTIAHSATVDGLRNFAQGGERDGFAATRRAIVRAAASLATKDAEVSQ